SSLGAYLRPASAACFRRLAGEALELSAKRAVLPDEQGDFDDRACEQDHQKDIHQAVPPIGAGQHVKRISIEDQSDALDTTCSRGEPPADRGASLIEGARAFWRSEAVPPGVSRARDRRCRRKR